VTVGNLACFDGLPEK